MLNNKRLHPAALQQTAAAAESKQEGVLFLEC
jgi:hypothetical protein